MAPRRSTLAHRVREARLDAGITQQSLAAMAGMSGPYVNLLERGRRTSTRADSLLRLSSALGVRPEWLLYGHELATR